jgi:hypothetical protein
MTKIKTLKTLTVSVMARVKGQDKQIHIVAARNSTFLIAVYFSHLLVFSYKNLRLCRES